MSPAYVARAGIFKQSMGARNRVGIGLSYWSLESIPGLHKRLKIRALATDTTTLFLLGSLAPINCYKIPTLVREMLCKVQRGISQFILPCKCATLKKRGKKLNEQIFLV
jgi:hypothetical protein